MLLQYPVSISAGERTRSGSERKFSWTSSCALVFYSGLSVFSMLLYDILYFILVLFLFNFDYRCVNRLYLLNTRKFSLSSRGLPTDRPNFIHSDPNQWKLRLLRNKQ